MNAYNPFDSSYIKNLEVSNLQNFFGVDKLTSIPSDMVSTVQGILTTNYIELGKDIIHNVRTNKQLHAKVKELGFELYTVVGEGALFITEDNDGKLKSLIESTSNIGNLMFIPFKNLGIIVYGLLMTACSGFPPCALIHRVLKTSNRFLQVATKTLELFLRIGTGNLEEFNNMLQLIIEAFVMVPKTISKLLKIIMIGRQIGKALRGEEIEVDEDFMSENGGLMGKMGLDNAMGDMSLPGMGSKDKDGKKDKKKDGKKSKKNKTKKKKKK